MTSKSLLWKSSKQNMRKRVPLIIIGALFCILLISIVNYVDSLNVKNMLDMGVPAYIFQNMQTVQLNPLNGNALIAVVAMAMLLCISGWAWNNKRYKVDFYKSLPVSELGRWIYINLNNLIIFVVCFAISLVITDICIISMGVQAAGIFGGTVKCLLTDTLIFIAVYMVLLIAQQLTGNGILAFLGGLYLLAAEPVVMALLNGYREIFYSTLWTPGNDYIVSGFAGGYLSPISVIAKMMCKGDKGNVAVELVILVVQSVVYGYIAYRLYKARSNQAGNGNIAFAKAKPIIKCMIMIPVVLLISLFFVSLRIDKTLVVVGFVIGTVVCQILLQYVLDCDFKAVVRGIPTLIISTAVSGMIILFFVLDLSGFDSFVPEAAEVESVALVCGEGRFSRETSYYDNETLIVKNMKITDRAVIEAVIQCVSDYVDEGGYEYNIYDYNMTYENTSELRVCFNMKNGKQITRSYIMDNARLAELCKCYYDTPEYKEYYTDSGLKSVMDVLNKDNVNWDFRYISFYNSNENGITDMKEMEALCNAWVEDYKARTSDIIASSKPVGYMQLNVFDYTNVEYVVYSNANCCYWGCLPIYSCDTNTLNELDRLGVDYDLGNYAEAESVSIYLWDYEGAADSGDAAAHSMVITKDDPLFEKVAACAVPYYGACDDEYMNILAANDDFIVTFNYNGYTSNNCAIISPEMKQTLVALMEAQE